MEKIKVLSDEVLTKKYQFDYINVDISTLNFKTEIFDIIFLFFIYFYVFD